MSRETTLAKIAAMAQLLDDHGLYDDAAVMDELLEAAASPGILREAGLWRNILSRLGGWARKVLFREYREMYAAAKNSQEIIDAQIEDLQNANRELKGQLARHELPAWREGMSGLIANLGKTDAEFLSGYDEQLAKMTARLLKLAPKKEKEKAEKKEPVMPSLLPEEKAVPATPAGKPAGPVPATEPAGTPEEPIPLTKVKKPAPVPEPTAAPAAEPAAEPAVEPTTEPTTETAAEPAAEPATEPAPAAPMPGWKKEKFGTSGKHGWEWEWEVSPDNARLRIPKNQLAAASSGKGKILHRQGDKYRPTGGTSSVKLRRLMGGVFWQAEDDPTDPNMVVLVRTEETVPFPLSMRQEPMEQARKLKDLGKTSKERMDRLMVLAVGGPVEEEEASEEEKLDAAAEVLLRGFESEETEEEV